MTLPRSISPQPSRRQRRLVTPATRAALALAPLVLAALALTPLAPSSPAFAQVKAPTPLATPDTAPLTIATNTPVEQPASRPRLGESVAAVVNDDMISSYDLRQRMRLLVATSGVQPSPDNIPQIEHEALRALVDEHLEMQEVHDIQTKQKDLHLEPSDKEIEETIGDMAKQSGLKPEQFLETLRSDDVNLSTLRDELRARLSWERYIGARYRDSVDIADNEIKAAFTHANATASKPQYLVSEIFIDAAQVGGQQAAVGGADQLVAQMQQGAPFASVARQFSKLPTAANGGDAGWLTAGDMPPEIQSVLEQMRPGQLSRPISVSDGVYIVALRDKRAGADAMVVDLKQAAVSLPAEAAPADVTAAQTKLDALRGKITGCDTVETAAAKTPGVVAGDLGETEVKDLRPSFQKAIAGLDVGQVSEPVRTDAGLHLIVVCERHASGARAVTKAEIEDKLRGVQYDMFARRFLRDLRNSATIETR